MLLLQSEAMVIRIGIKKQISTKHAILLFAAILIPGYKGNEIDKYARAQRSFHEINEYARMQRDLAAYARAQRAATNFENGNEEENGKPNFLNELVSPEDQIDNMKLNNQNDLTDQWGMILKYHTPRYESDSSDLHKVNTRAGMRLRRLRRGGAGSKNMRLRRLRRADGSMDEKFQPIYLGKRPSYASPIESALNEIMANSMCTVVGRLVPCIRSPVNN